MAPGGNYLAVFASPLYGLPFPALLLAAWHQVGSKPSLWAYLIIFFTGLRPSEIGKLHTSDFSLIEGVWYFDLRSKEERGIGADGVKTAASARLVPIPRLLVDL